VSRWFAGLPVPGPVAAAVDAWMRLYRLTGLRPDQLDQTADSTEGGVEPDALPRK
jgi:hypothetical protein